MDGGTEPAGSTNLMEPITLDQPVASKTTRSNYVVMMAGIGVAREHCDFLLLTAENFVQAITAARNALGEHFYPAVALDPTGLRDLADAVENFKLRPGEMVNATADENLDACIRERARLQAQAGC